MADVSEKVIDAIMASADEDNYTARETMKEYLIERGVIVK